jgi:hypothetical protein
MSVTQSVPVSASGGSFNDFQLKAFQQGVDGTVATATMAVAGWAYKRLGPTATTVVKIGPGQFHTIISATAVGNISIYDGVDTTGTLIQGTYANAVGSITFDVCFSVGLTIVLSGADVCTVTFR